MRRRVLLILLAPSLAVAACASVLGDFNVDDTASNLTDSGLIKLADGAYESPDGTIYHVTPDGSLSTSSSTSSSGSTSGGSDSGYQDPVNPAIQPHPVAIATTAAATCATVDYSTDGTQRVTYCWGERTGTSIVNEDGLGDSVSDTHYGNFHRPRVSGQPIVLQPMMGAATGDWFIGAAPDGNYYSWGADKFSQTGRSDPKVDPVTSYTAAPGMVANVNPAKNDAFFAGERTGWLLQGGSLFGWGDNGNCEVTSLQFGSSNCAGSIIGTPTKQNGDLFGTAALSAPVVGAIAAGTSYSCVGVTGADATRGANSDTVKCWGTNTSYGESGQFDGNGKPTAGDVTSPTVVSGLPTNVLEGAAGYELAAGGFHTCLLVHAMPDAVYCWGNNGAGQAQPKAVAAAVPASKIDLPNADMNLAGSVTNLALGPTVSCVSVVNSASVTHAGCFGSSALLGRPNASGNIAVVDTIVNVQQIAVGTDHVCAIASSGASTAPTPALGVWCWGSNNHGQLDPTTTTDDAAPAPRQIYFPSNYPTQ